MSVQDDERERELVRMFNLDWDHAHQRAGVDASLSIDIDGYTRSIEVEVKSSTTSTVSTARDVSMEHLQKWRTKIFVIGFYTRDARRPELKSCLCLTPTDMEPWIHAIEEKIKIDFRLAQSASRRLVAADLYEVFGHQQTYSVEDAKRLHKQQWTTQQYATALDIVVDGVRRISEAKMLEILQLRSKYISERGATLNNPHINKSHLDRFIGTDRDIRGPNWAEAIRRIASTFIRDNPQHPAIK